MADPPDGRLDCQQAIREYLESMVKLRGTPPNPAHISPEAFILAHGRPYLARRRPAKYPLGEIKQCFANSQQLALTQGDLIYVDGLVISANVPFPITHGWCIDRRGRVVDITLRDTQHRCYFGVPFQTDYIRELIQGGLKHWGSLIDNFEQRWPLLTGTVRLEDAIRGFKTSRDN